MFMILNVRLVKSAKPVTYVTYEEAAELAYFGAEVNTKIYSSIMVNIFAFY